MAILRKEFKADIKEAAANMGYSAAKDTADWVFSPRVQHASELRYEGISRRSKRELSALADQMERSSEALSNMRLSSKPEITETAALLNTYVKYIDVHGSDKLKAFTKEMLEKAGDEMAAFLRTPGKYNAHNQQFEEIIKKYIIKVLGDDAFKANGSVIEDLSLNSKALAKMISRSGKLMQFSDPDKTERAIEAGAASANRMFKQQSLDADVSDRITDRRRYSTIKDNIDRILVVNALLELNHTVHSRLRVRAGNQMEDAAKLAESYHNTYYDYAKKLTFEPKDLIQADHPALVEFVADIYKVHELTKDALHYVHTHKALDKMTIQRINTRTIMLVTIYNSIADDLEPDQKEKFENLIKIINGNVEKIAHGLDKEPVSVHPSDLKVGTLKYTFKNSDSRQDFLLVLNQRIRNEDIYEFFGYHTEKRVNVGAMVRKLSELREAIPKPRPGKEKEEEEQKPPTPTPGTSDVIEPNVLIVD